MLKPSKNPINWNDIKLLIFDCDGVLTDGKITYTADTIEIKSFNAHDGMGFMLLNRAGLFSAVITGRTSAALEQRCKDIEIKNLYQGVQRKLKVAIKIMEIYRLGWHQIVYMGDDWNDVPVMQKCAFSVCPQDAMPEIQQLADMVTQRKASEGAARELIDFVLYQKGIYEEVVQEYLDDVSAL